MPTTTARGYGHQHRKLRAAWAPRVATGTITCWRCLQPILPGQPWDLGHDDHDRTQYRGPEHANQCNRATAARRTNQLRRARTRQQPTLIDNDW